MNSWSAVSRRHLTRILLETPRLEGESLESWKRRLKKTIAEGYPFVQRSGWAYQAWLKERKKLLACLGMTEAPLRVRQKPVSPGQIELFEV